MRLEVFGADGGIGDPLRTLALRVDADLLVEAGSGLGELPLDALALIDHVFLSHSHLDHIACLPLLVDAVASLRDTPVIVHANSATISALREHVFNWTLWPDFTRLPSPEAPALRFAPLELGESVELAGRRITPLPAKHTVPTVGFLLEGAQGSLAYTADTTVCDELWRALNRVQDLRALIIETSFDDARKPLTGKAGHLCPELLVAELARLERPADIYIAHTKPGLREAIEREIAAHGPARMPRFLARGQTLEF